jgi:chromosome segregation ATPase
MKNHSVAQLLLVLCLLLTSCKETKQMQAEIAVVSAKIVALQTELAQMDTQIAEMRRSLPGGADVTASAKQKAVLLAAEVVALEKEIKQVQDELQFSESALSSERQDLQALQARGQR